MLNKKENNFKFQKSKANQNESKFKIIKRERERNNFCLLNQLDKPKLTFLTHLILGLKQTIKFNFY